MATKRSDDKTGRWGSSPRVSKGASLEKTQTTKTSKSRAQKATPAKRKSTKPLSSVDLEAHSFPPTLGELDLHLFGEGRHEQIYEKLGAHLITHEGVDGVSFAVWAPAADTVSVVGNFNGWDGNTTSNAAPR